MKKYMYKHHNTAAIFNFGRMKFIGDGGIRWTGKPLKRSVWAVFHK